MSFSRVTPRSMASLPPHADRPKISQRSFTGRVPKERPATWARWMWLDGELLAWEEATVHVLSHALHYGTGIFEGVRCYAINDRTLGLFRLRDHLERLHQSASFLSLEIPYSVGELEGVCQEVVTRNRLADCYVRPFAFYGLGEMGFSLTTNAVHVGIAAWPWGVYLGPGAMERGIRLKTVSWRKTPGNCSPCSAKLAGNYVNCVLAFREAQRAGFDEALLLNGAGNIAEGSGENVFAVRHGEILTPPPADDNLPGLTRDSVIRIAQSLRIPIREASLSRSDLLTANEVFLTGTAAEITPVREIDWQPVGNTNPGPITARLRREFTEVVRGRVPQYSDWVVRMPRGEPVSRELA
jgi:branched-chain amino acid aminotransferase